MCYGCDSQFDFFVTLFLVSLLFMKFPHALILGCLAAKHCQHSCSQHKMQSQFCDSYAGSVRLLSSPNLKYAFPWCNFYHMVFAACHVFFHKKECSSVRTHKLCVARTIRNPTRIQFRLLRGSTIQKEVKSSRANWRKTEKSTRTTNYGSRYSSNSSNFVPMNRFQSQCVLYMLLCCSIQIRFNWFRLHFIWTKLNCFVYFIYCATIG